MILQKYIAGINSLVIVVLSALVAIPSGQLDFTSGAQLVAVGLSGVGLYILPLLDVTWRGIAKTGTAILGAAVATGFPIFQAIVNGEPWRPLYVALIVLAVAHALGTQLGVDVRTDTAAMIATDPTPTEANIEQNIVARNDQWPVTDPAPGEFAVGAGYQDPAANYTDTATLSAVNPANQETDSQ